MLVRFCSFGRAWQQAACFGVYSDFTFLDTPTARPGM
jgi:hypothetical protein